MPTYEPDDMNAPTYRPPAPSVPASAPYAPPAASMPSASMPAMPKRPTEWDFVPQSQQAYKSLAGVSPTNIFGTNDTRRMRVEAARVNRPYAEASAGYDSEQARRTAMDTLYMRYVRPAELEAHAKAYDAGQRAQAERYGADRRAGTEAVGQALKLQDHQLRSIAEGARFFNNWRAGNEAERHNRALEARDAAKASRPTTHIGATAKGDPILITTDPTTGKATYSNIQPEGGAATNPADPLWFMRGGATSAPTATPTPDATTSVKVRPKPSDEIIAEKAKIGWRWDDNAMYNGERGSFVR